MLNMNLLTTFVSFWERWSLLIFFNSDHYTTLWNSAITTGPAFANYNSMVDYVCSSLIQMTVESRDLPQAEKKLLSLQAE